jgi:PAS domain S-box-containing protein
MHTPKPLKRGLARRITLLLLVPFFGAVVALLLVLFILAEIASAPAQLNVSGRQRMLAVQLGDWANMVMSGQDEDRPRLRELIDKYELYTTVLEQGGEVNGQYVAPLRGAPRAELMKVRAEWNGIRSSLVFIAEQPSSNLAWRRATVDLGSATEALRTGNERVTGAVEAKTKGTQERLWWIAVSGVGFSFAMVVFGAWHARKYIVHPVFLVNDAAKRLSEGDYAVRIVCETRDELCRLAETFNEMATRVQGLLVALDQRREHAELLADSLPVGTALLSSDLKVLRTNRAFRETFGEVESRQPGIEEILRVPGIGERLLALRASNSGEHVDAEVSLPSGLRQIRVFAKDTRLEDEDDEGRLLLIVEDLSEEARLRVEARASEESFRALIEASPDGIAVLRDGRFAFVNPAMAEMLGYESPRELTETPVLEIVHPSDRAAVTERAKAMLASGERTPHEERRLIRKNGAEVTVEVAALKATFRGERAIVAIARDVTARKVLQAKMLEMDRMIAVGTLAAGVGHEINNPLSYVVANLDLLAEELPKLMKRCRRHQALAAPMGGSPSDATAVSQKLDELAQLVDEARQGAERVRSVVRDLKTLSRPEKEHLGLLDVRLVLESSINMSWNEIRHRARLVKDYSDVPPVEANEARLGQVFINLLVNAAQSLPEGAAETNEIRVRTRLEEGRVVVEIEDNGPGIPETHLHRLFEPFFTTKPIGQGTGLGLAISKRTLECFGGDIAVTTQVGEGATFRVTLPAAPASDSPCPAIVEEAKTATRRGRILVVDDEPMAGRVLQRALGDHDVVTFTRAREALDLIAGGERFDLIFCDIMMPEMTGMDLHDELVGVAPEQVKKMIFVTGGAFSARSRQFLDTVTNQRIDKPFDIKNVRALVRDLLK